MIEQRVFRGIRKDNGNLIASTYIKQTPKRLILLDEIITKWIEIYPETLEIVE